MSAIMVKKGFIYTGLLNQVGGFVDGDYLLVACERNKIEKMIIDNHYSHTMPKNSAYCFLVFYNGNVEGAISIGYGIRPKMKHTWGIAENEKALEFDRMWLSDIPPKNSESKVISMLIKTLRKIDHELRWLISYSDGTVGNTGTIYKASNFKELPSLKADFYILKCGTRVHPVTMYHRHGSRAWNLLQSIYPNIKKADGRQYRFIRRI